MLPLRLLLPAIFLVSLPFGLCSSSSSDTTGLDQTRALTLALVAIGDNPGDIPPVGTAYDCAIHISNQPAPPASPFHDVHGNCLWTLTEQGGPWLATFRESWLCDDWSAHVAGYPDCVAPIGSHEWQYQASLDGRVQQIANSGSYAPDQH